jgi:pimeloyl-ACP methyl ester carboxylesterase
LISVETVPYANNQGVRIRYEVEGSGSPLVLLHGLAGYLESWHELGYVDSLKKDHTLVLMDMRGHGGSDKPHDPEAYRLKLLVADVIAVMDALNISKTHFLGYSLGGRMAFALAKYAPERFHSFIVGGQSPNARPRARIRWWLQILKKGMGAYVEECEKGRGIKMTPQMRTKILSNDTEALAAFVSASEWRANLEDALPNLTMPCLLFVGEADPSYAGARECASLLPNAEFVSFPGFGHEVDFQSHLVLPHIKKFLKKVDHA